MNRLLKLLNWQWIHTVCLLILLVIGGGYVTYKVVYADELHLGGYRVVGISNSLSEDDSTLLASQKAIKEAIDAAVIGGGNVMNALSIMSYGAVEGSSSGGDRTANRNAWDAMVAAAADGQMIVIPDGTFYFPQGDTLVASSTAKKFNIWVIGNITGAGFRISGNYHQFRSFAILNGGNTGASDSAGFRAYTGDGLCLENALNCEAWVNRVIAYHNGVVVSGRSTTTPKGAQYNKVYFNSIRWCYRMVYNTTYGATDRSEPGDRGNWSNSNYYYGGQVGGGTNPVTGGVFGVVVAKDTSSNQTDNSPFNYNEFHGIGYEGVKHGIVVKNGDLNLFSGGRWESNAVTYKINLGTGAGDSTSSYRNTIRMSGLYEEYFVSWGVGTDIPSPMLTSNGVISADVNWAAGSTARVNMLGDEPTNIVSTLNTIVVGGFGGNKGDRYAIRVVRPSLSIDDFVSLDGHTVTITGTPHNIATTTKMVLNNYTSGTSTINLPTASSFDEREIYIVNITTSNNCTVNGVTLAPGESILWKSNGTSWYAIGAPDGRKPGRMVRISDANYSVGVTDYSVTVHSMTATRTITMPTASSFPDRVLYVIQSDGGAQTLNLSQDIYENEAAISAITEDKMYMVQSDGTRWNVIMSK